jgi:hypothetical protein
VSLELLVLLLVTWKLWTPFFMLASRYPIITLLIVLLVALPALAR